jgi:hypothetical protein
VESLLVPGVECVTHQVADLRDARLNASFAYPGPALQAGASWHARVLVHVKIKTVQAAPPGEDGDAHQGTHRVRRVRQLFDQLSSTKVQE